ncbi:MAG TPA: phosphotransferase [Candidatus Dormibacteraeota bacterium]|jgi:Ser/Thr protein kinase RdoA (MazF antagonist)|nr:phosphotransferase [Candidatus Dormibacteraeota bacterium]
MEGTGAELRELVERSYRGDLTGIRSVAHHTFEDRVILRCEFRAMRPCLLQAFTGDVERWLLHQAEVLCHLRAVGFPAPRLVPTADGAPLARGKAWIGIMLTFVEGEQADHDLRTLERLGEQAGALHRIAGGDLAPSPKAPPSAPSRRRELDRLEGADLVPECARSFHRAAVDTWRGLTELDRLPECVVHGDCWPDNAIRTPAGEVVLIDWEAAGRGHAVLDLGYLLLATSFSSSAGAGGLVVNRPGIEAVAGGYGRLRRPTDKELEWLPNAVRFDIVSRAMAMDAFRLGAAGWGGQCVAGQDAGAARHLG